MASSPSSPRLTAIKALTRGELADAVSQPSTSESLPPELQQRVDSLLKGGKTRAGAARRRRPNADSIHVTLARGDPGHRRARPPAGPRCRAPCREGVRCELEHSGPLGKGRPGVVQLAAHLIEGPDTFRLTAVIVGTLVPLWSTDSAMTRIPHGTFWVNVRKTGWVPG